MEGGIRLKWIWTGFISLRIGTKWLNVVSEGGMGGHENCEISGLADELVACYMHTENVCNIV
jgi:hypothetical protein